MKINYFDFEIDNIKAFTTVRDTEDCNNPYIGSNICSYTNDDAVNIGSNLSKLALELRVAEDDIIQPRQIHNTDIVEITPSYFDKGKDEQSKLIYGYDAVFTRIPGVVVGINTADCVPILIADKKSKIVCAVHAGWRGTVAHICSKVIEHLISEGLNKEDISVYIGASICQGCFEVGNEVVEEFKNNGFDISSISYIDKTSGKPHIDLKEANRQDLIRYGIKDTNITISDECTKCNPKRYYSARNLGIDSGRNYTGIFIKKN